MMDVSLEDKNKYRRGQAWLCDFGERRGSLVNGKHPCIIVSNSMNNRFATILSVIPITSKIHKAKLPVHVSLTTEDGMAKDSVATIEQQTTINKVDLISLITTLRPDKIKEIETAILIHNEISL